MPKSGIITDGCIPLCTSSPALAWLSPVAAPWDAENLARMTHTKAGLWKRDSLPCNLEKQLGLRNHTVALRMFGSEQDRPSRGGNAAGGCKLISYPQVSLSALGELSPNRSTDSVQLDTAFSLPGQVFLPGTSLQYRQRQQLIPMRNSQPAV